MIKLKRAKEDPILSPTNYSWENKLVFNPGAIEYDNKIILLYRAMGIEDEVSRIGIANSDDGINFVRSQYPMYYGGDHPSEILGIEDIRVVKMGDTYYLVYTAVSPRKLGSFDSKFKGNIDKKPQIGLSTTQDFLTFMDYDVIIPGIEGKDASLFPEQINGEYILIYREGSTKTFLADSTKINYWPQRFFLFENRPQFWDSKRVGIGAPPIKTDKGWLLFYHGIDDKDIYRLGIIFLDLKDPRKIIYRSPEPIFEPEASYERFGYVSNVVFTCGAIEKDDKYFVYYGAADQVIGLATVEKKDVLNLI